MINWYVQISDNAPQGFKCDIYLGNVIDTATPFMNYFCKRLSELDNWNIDDAETIFKDIIDEMPIMSSMIINKEFIIRYNRWVSIRLTDTTKQIYRDIKLEKILT
jgi:hypothetical protein